MITQIEVAKEYQPIKTNINGFTNTLSLYQIATCILSALSFTIFMTIVHSSGVPTVSSSFKTTISIVVSVLFLFDLITWYKATSIIPTDQIQILYEQYHRKGINFDFTIYKFCQKCKSYCSDNCYHCQQCHRCVALFNHHSKWLNNCVGAKNYFQFFWLIIITLIIFLIQLSASIYILIKFTGLPQGQQYPISLNLICFELSLNSICLIPLFYINIYHMHSICSKQESIIQIIQHRKSNRISPSLACKQLIKKSTIVFANKNNENLMVNRAQSEQYSKQDSNRTVQPLKAIIKLLPPLETHKFQLTKRFNFVHKNTKTVKNSIDAKY